MQKARYEVDPYNRLVITPSGREGALPRFRRVLDGRFKTDSNNNLTYHVKSPLSGAGGAPNQIRIGGEWSLTGDHNLRLSFGRTERRTLGEQITLKADLLAAGENSVSFAVNTTSKDGTRSTYVLELGGSWKADSKNRLTFHVKRERGLYDILIFNGAWQINKDLEIVYRYEKSALIRKKKEIHEITFKGRWDIAGRTRISYILGADSNSGFEFATSAGLFKDDRIVYELGIGLSGGRPPVKRVITISGAWRLRPDAVLVFEAGFGKRRARSIAFGADLTVSGKDTVSFRLKRGADGEDTGIALELSRKILSGDGEAFLRLAKSARESSAMAGAAFRW